MRILIVEDQYIEAHDLQLIVEDFGYEVIGMARSVVEALEMIAENPPDLVLVDIFLRGPETGIDLARKLSELSIGFIFISANSGKDILNEAKKTQPYGFIVKPFREDDVRTTLEIVSWRNKFSLEAKLKKQESLKQILSNLNLTSASREDIMLQVGVAMQSFVPFDYLEVGHVEGTKFNTLGLLLKKMDQYQIIDGKKLAQISGQSLSTLARIQNDFSESYNGLLYNSEVKKSECCTEYRRIIMENFAVRSFVSVPVYAAGELFDFCFYNRSTDSYEAEHLQLLQDLKYIFKKLVHGVILTKVTQDKKEKALQKYNKVSYCYGFKDLVGKSERMYRVFDHIHKVAPSNTSVLILGESGTGKEQVAKSIHNLSSRKNKPLVIINCASIPENLAESLLFGHEKGSFTGALEKRTGKFEQADGGTIFLDEIGEMSNDLQVKLLRVLQEKEIERIGGKAPIKVDVRIIAATNRNLEEEVAAGKFRLDLYYRLHVFPIVVPSLRERKEDILDLATYFIQAYCENIGREYLTITPEAIRDMLNYHWPGNVRELENSIQRTILLCEGSSINEIMLPNHQKQEYAPSSGEVSLKTIQENERDYIAYILSKCKGKIAGKGGAAEILNIPPSTLNSRIKKLGIIVNW